MNSSSQSRDGLTVISGGKLSRMCHVRLIGNQNRAAQSASGRTGGFVRPLPALAPRLQGNPLLHIIFCCCC